MTSGTKYLVNLLRKGLKKRKLKFNDTDSIRKLKKIIQKHEDAEHKKNGVLGRTPNAVVTLYREECKMQDLSIFGKEDVLEARLKANAKANAKEKDKNDENPKKPNVTRVIVEVEGDVAAKDFANIPGVVRARFKKGDEEKYVNAGGCYWKKA